MARRKQPVQPRQTQYKNAASIDVSREEGRGELLTERLKRARQILEIQPRDEMRRETWGYVNGRIALKGEGEKVYLNEALPALEDVIFGTMPAMPPVMTEARQTGPDQEMLADMVGAMVDSVLSSGLCRAHQAIIAAEWDEIGWGVGFLKTAWHRHDRPARPRISTDETYIQPHVQAALWENANPRKAMVAEHDDDRVHILAHRDQPALEEHVRAHYGRLGRRTFAHPVVHRLNPARFLYDPDAEEWEERDWEAELCEELVTSLQDLPGIKNLSPENCPAVDEFDNRNSSNPQHPDNSFDYAKTRVRVWKIHDLVDDSYIILPDGPSDRPKPVLEADWPYGSLDIYRPIVHRPIPGQVHGHSTLLLIKPVLDELARTNARIRRHNRRAANAKPLGVRGQFDKQFEKELEDPDTPWASAPNAASLALMKEWKPPPVPKELLQHRDMLLSELRRILASDIITQGGDTPHPVTAREAVGRMEYAAARVRRRKQIVSDALSWIARNIVLLTRDWADEDIPVRIIGPQGAEVKRLDPAAIPEDLIVRLDIEAVSEERLSQDMQAATVFADKVMSYAPDVANRVELLKLLGDKLRIRNPEKFFVTPEEAAPVAPAGGASASKGIAFPKQPGAGGLGRLPGTPIGSEQTA